MKMMTISETNVLSSDLPKITNYENTYVHELIWQEAEKWPNRIALICPDTNQEYRYGQLRHMCKTLAKGLSRMGLISGDTIAVISPNVPDLVIIVLAANESGLRTTLINPAYTSEEIKRQLEETGVQAVFTYPAKCNDIKRSIENNTNIKLPIILMKNNSNQISPIPETLSYDEILTDGVNDDFLYQEPPAANLNYEDTVFLFYTDGITGPPKAVELTHRNVVANILQFSHPLFFIANETTSQYQDVIPVILPMHNPYGLIYIMYGYLRFGARLVCIPKFTTTEFIRLCKRYMFTLLHAVPSIFEQLSYEYKVTPECLQEISTIILTGTPIHEACVSRFLHRFHYINIVQIYGATEMSAIVTCGIRRDTLPTSCGFLVRNTEMRIVGCNPDNWGQNLGPFETGEIYIRGPQVMKGYYNNPKDTANVMDDGWYKTGDLGYHAEQSTLYVTGRLKDIIHAHGRKISPHDLEQVISKDNKIRDVVVVGVKMYMGLGEVPKAFVALLPGFDLDEDEIKDRTNELVMKNQQLEYVEFLQSIPRNEYGKPLSQKLKKSPVTGSNFYWR